MKFSFTVLQHDKRNVSKAAKLAKEFGFHSVLIGIPECHPIRWNFPGCFVANIVQR
jgi:hypothetical protein